ncbi:SDR family NAD(P)-dependent oxidoreductase [Mycobacterium branderi]|uniref:Short-chain dehydrogenase n=1 Tax=Mycobacterium branderi TaxID=43348 RepID=A0A7I7W6C0_9MYCO|nr:SDR family oxidoreductase [Mycobacterium branderi]MCV7235048.1 SDR family oxidoreductase [Mycobacterium branderi]ORA36720.1 hypothetical protein BST20_15595 [Mycobacterium branderi]BBZ11318.1 short-chain dehydrogenase [Mycobacterium branderi]
MSGNDLTGFTAFVTGGSSGMGFEMAKELLAHGATVTIGARAGSKLDNAQETLRREGYDVHAVHLDVRDEKSVDEAAKWFFDKFDHLDMLVNNAGLGYNADGMTFGEADPQFYDIPPSTFNAIVETNFTGVFLVSRAFVPVMVKQRRGRVVNVSTSTSTMERMGMIPYGPSKAAMEAMSRIQAQELKDLGVTVNVICPGGLTDTGMTDAIKTQLSELGSPMLGADILNEVILFLSSPQSDGLTGEKIVGAEFAEWLESKNISFSKGNVRG